MNQGKKYSELTSTQIFTPLQGIYNPFSDGYFNHEQYMLNRHGKLVTEYRAYNYFDKKKLINLDKFSEALEKAGFGKPKLFKYSTNFNKKEKRYSVDWFLFLREEEVVINIDFDAVKDIKNVEFRFDSVTAVEGTTVSDMESIFKVADKCLVNAPDDRTRYINIVSTAQRTGLILTRHKIKPPRIPDLDLYYGKNFEKKHEQFLSVLNDKEKSGLFILHGDTGTGKTNYIRYLIASGDPDISFIFYPISLLRNIAGPELISFLADYKDSILVIEESEETVQTRDKFDTDKSSIANLLNVSDGLLSDVLNLKIICTFNTDIRNLDKALLREGRLLGIHKFEKLSVEQANNIAAYNKLDKEFEKPATLAQIFNKPLNEDLSDFVDQDKKIGF